MTDLINSFIDIIVEFAMFFWPEILIEPEIISNIDKYISFAIDLLKQINFLVPVPLIFTVLSIQITLKVGTFALWIVNWIIKRVFDVIP